MSIYFLHTFSIPYRHSVRAEMLMLIENVVTHIFQFMSQSLYSAEYTIEGQEGRERHVFTHGRFCLQTHVSTNQRLCQVVLFSFDSNCLSILRAF